MTLNAWSFLVSRNQSVDYKTIVAPDFIDAANLRSLLTKVTEGDRTPPDKANIRWIQRSKAGDFSIVFRVIEATAADIGETSGAILKDSFGRDIYLVEGLIIQGAPSSLGRSIKSSNLEFVHAQMKLHYQRFWSTNETAISDCFPFQEGDSGQILRLEELESIVASPKSKKTGKFNRDTVSAYSDFWELMKLQSNFLPILVTTAVVLILFSLLIGQMFHGADITGQAKISEDCSYMTQLQQIPYGEPKEWLKTLEDLKKKNQAGTLFVSTVTPNQLQLPATQKVPMEEPTFKQENGTIQMKFHPLQQALVQLHDKQNNKFLNNTTLEVRIIKPTQNDKKQCLQSLQTS